MDKERPAVAELMANVSATLATRATELYGDVYEVILREIPPLRGDKPVLTLLAASVHGNIDTCLQVMQHRIDLAKVNAPAAAEEYARRLAQRGTPLAALLRAYRVGHARFFDWILNELAQQTNDAELVSTTALSMSSIVAEYIDQTSEDIVLAYEQEKENWLRSRSTARAARVRALLSGDRIDVRAAEETLGYRLRQYHVGLVCWIGDAASATDEITRLERATSYIAGQAACHGDPVFLPRDETSAWAWLPFGIRDTFGSAAAAACTTGADIAVHFAFGDAAKGTTGFLTTHQQAIAAQAVALAAAPPIPRVTTFSEVAPVALIVGSWELLRVWVVATLAELATDDEHHSRLQDTLHVFLQCGGSYKATAEQLMLHKNQEHRPVPDPQSRGKPRPPSGREPAERRTRPAGQPLARLCRSAAGRTCRRWPWVIAPIGP